MSIKAEYDRGLEAWIIEVDPDYPPMLLDGFATNVDVYVDNIATRGDFGGTEIQGIGEEDHFDDFGYFSLVELKPLIVVEPDGRRHRYTAAIVEEHPRDKSVEYFREMDDAFVVWEELEGQLEQHLENHPDVENYAE